MKNFLRIIAFCSFLSIQLTLSSMVSKKEFSIEIKYKQSGDGKSNHKVTDNINILNSTIDKSFTIMIKKDNSVKDILMNSLELLNQILNSDLIKAKVLVNHNWNRESLNTALGNCSNMQAIKRSLFLINHFNENNENNENNDLFKKTIESCSFFLDKLSRDLAADPSQNLAGKNNFTTLNQSAQKLYSNIKSEVNQPNIPLYLKYPFFGYYYIQFILFSEPLKQFFVSKIAELKNSIFKKQTTNNGCKY